MVPLATETLAGCAARLPVPGYDRSRVTAGVAHLGVGAFHRAHQAVYHDRLLAAGGSPEWGICGIGVLPGDRALHEALRAQDGLYTVMVKEPDGSLAPRVIGSLVEHLLAPDDPEAVVERLAAPAIRVVSLTITEGGYASDDATGAFRADDPAVAADLADPAALGTAFALVVEALRRRRARGVAPFTVMSCDNLPGNGHAARTAFAGFAALRDPELGAWVAGHVAFPSSMVDRITPRTTDLDRAALAELFGVEDRVPVVCEPFSQWVLEDRPGLERPPYEDAGVVVVGDVAPHERMKLRLLNAGHQAVAHFGRLLGHAFVHEAVADPELLAFLEGFLDREAAPTLGDVPRADLEAFRGPLVGRFANRAIADTLERLATDASDRIPKFVLPIVADRLAAGQDAGRCAAVVAAWAWAWSAAGGAVPAPEDRRAAALAERAADLRHAPDAFLADRELFGDLGATAAFAEPYRRAVAMLAERGPRATLAALA